MKKTRLFNWAGIFALSLLLAAPVLAEDDKPENSEIDTAFLEANCRQLAEESQISGEDLQSYIEECVAESREEAEELQQTERGGA